MLSVTIPASVAVQLVRDAIPDKHGEIRRLLEQIPPESRIWDLQAGGAIDKAARQLWALLIGIKGLGRTKTSKLLAVKRPHLLPIYDRYVGAALLSNKSKDDWVAWSEHLSGDDGQKLRTACEQLRKKADAPENVSVLRILDIVIWMRESQS